MKYTKSVVVARLETVLRQRKETEKLTLIKEHDTWERTSRSIAENRSLFRANVGAVWDEICQDRWVEAADTWSRVKYYSMGPLSQAPEPTLNTTKFDEVQSMIDLIQGAEEDWFSSSELERLGIMQVVRYPR